MRNELRRYNSLNPVLADTTRTDRNSATIPIEQNSVEKDDEGVTSSSLRVPQATAFSAVNPTFRASSQFRPADSVAVAL